MQTVAKFVVWGAVVILGAGMGLRWIFAPESAGSEYGMTFDGAMALNQARGDIGGVFFGLGIITTLGLVRREPLLLRAVAIAIASVIFGRVVGLVLDGFTAEVAGIIVVEAILAASFFVTANAMSANAGSDPASASVSG